MLLKAEHNCLPDIKQIRERVARKAKLLWVNLTTLIIPGEQ